MDNWSCTWLAEHVVFACASTAGAEVAMLFAEEFGFENVVNGYAESERDIPFGQLGCSGLIVFDAAGRLLVRAFTPTYLEARHKSFRMFEQWMKQTFRLSAPDRNKGPKACLRPAPEVHEKKAEETTTGKLIQLGIRELDEEHEECDVVLQQLLSAPTLGTLRAFLQLLQKHFAHEEEILAAHPSMPDRALASHKEDHRQMLKSLQNALDDGLTSEFLDEIKDRFFSHIQLFDMQYAKMVA